MMKNYTDKAKGKLKQVQGDMHEKEGGLQGIKGGMQKIKGKMEETTADARIDRKNDEAANDADK